jgi:hypothetical protein
VFRVLASCHHFFTTQGDASLAAASDKVGALGLRFGVMIWVQFWA